MRVVAHTAITDHDIGFARDDRCHQRRDIGAFVLVVGIGVDDDIGAFGQGLVQTAAEGGSQPAIAAVPHHVVDAVLARDLRGAIAAAIVDDEVFDHIDAGHFLGETGDRLWQVVRLVKRGYLDNEFAHRSLCLRSRGAF